MFDDKMLRSSCLQLSLILQLLFNLYVIMFYLINTFEFH